MNNKLTRTKRRRKYANERLALLTKIARLASELCTAVDLAEEDIGGARKSSVILGELGPLCDRLEKREAPLREKLAVAQFANAEDAAPAVQYITIAQASTRPIVITDDKNRINELSLWQGEQLIARVEFTPRKVEINSMRVHPTWTEGP